jgi:hypothetical protein
LVREIGDENYLRILKTEYEIQRFETYLPTNDEIFGAFEQKFTRFLGMLDYLPFYEELLVKGMKVFADDGYSAVEIRLVGLGEFVDKDFNKVSMEEFVERLVKIAGIVKEKYKLGKGVFCELFFWRFFKIFINFYFHE